MRRKVSEYMSYPKLEIYLNEASELCIVKAERPDSAPQLVVELALSELMSEGIDEASLQVGHGVITSLKRWHRQEFESAEVTVADGLPSDDSSELAHRLIAKSVENRTAVHLPSIEALLLAAANQGPDAKEFLDEDWPVIRQRLSTFSA